MGRSDADVVLMAQRGWEERDWELVVAALHPDVEWIDESRPLHGRTGRGRDDLREAYRTWVGTWSTYESGHGEAVEIGDGRVYLPVWERGRGKASGVEVERSFAVVGEVRDGLVVRLHSFVARADARAAVGLANDEP